MNCMSYVFITQLLKGYTIHPFPFPLPLPLSSLLSPLSFSPPLPSSSLLSPPFFSSLLLGSDSFFVTALYGTRPSHHTWLSPSHAAFCLLHSARLLLLRAAVFHAQLSLTRSRLLRAAISRAELSPCATFPLLGRCSLLTLIILDDILFEGTLSYPLVSRPLPSPPFVIPLLSPQLSFHCSFLLYTIYPPAHGLLPRTLLSCCALAVPSTTPPHAAFPSSFSIA